MSESGSLQQRFAFVNALRGLGALAVVLYHAAEGGHIPAIVEDMPWWLLAVMKHGGVSIAVFFTISGFVIAHAVYQHRVTLPFAGRFIMRRSMRLDPPYWVSIALVLAFGTLASMILPGKNPPDVSTGVLSAHLFYLQEMLGYPHINPVFWTLCLEMQFYLVYITILCISRNDPSQPLQGRATTIMLVLAMLTSMLWPMGVFQFGPVPGSFLPYWNSFLVGVAAYWAWRNPQIVPYFLAMTLTIITAALIRGDAFAFLCAASALMLWYVVSSGRSFRAFNWTWLQFLGAISYSLYLIHNSITGATFRVGYMITGHNQFWEAVWWAISIAACLVFAAVVWKFVERPSARWARTVNLDAQPKPRAQPSRTVEAGAFNAYLTGNDLPETAILKKI
jgi:peptidoglycan/LPS O-acetylase OafA/YrhL